MDINETKVRIAEIAASLTKLEMEQRPDHFRNSASVDDAFKKHYDAIALKFDGK